MTTSTARPVLNVHEYEQHHQPHYLYRCYDVDGRLLYIGCTMDTRKRERAHRAGYGRHGASPWLAVCMDRFEVDADRHLGRIAGRAAEAAAIKAEQPLFNYQRRAGINVAAWMTRAPIAQYLIDHGHLDLAAATVCTCWRETLDAGGFDSWCSAHVELARREAGAA